MVKKIKIVSIISICLIVLISGVLTYINYFSPIETARVNAEYVSFESINDLTDYSDLIVVAKAEKNIEECKPSIKYNSEGRVEDFYTVSGFKVLKVVKGNFSQKNVDVLQPVAVMNDGLGRTMRIIGDYYTPTVKNNKYLLFLKKVENENFYSVVSLEYGKYNLDNVDKDEASVTCKSQKYKKLKDNVIDKHKKEFDSAK